MKKIVLLSITLILLLACETGVKNQKTTHKVAMSGIVERTDTPSNKSSSYTKNKTSKQSFKKIFSNSAQPGYYLQVAVFMKNRPSKQFLQPLDNSKFNYIVLNKASKDYVLIGAYKSYAAAKSNVSSVRRALGKQTFVVQVLRP